jgi:hypothetical protein
MSYSVSCPECDGSLAQRSLAGRDRTCAFCGAELKSCRSILRLDLAPEEEGGLGRMTRRRPRITHPALRRSCSCRRWKRPAPSCS